MKKALHPKPSLTSPTELCKEIPIHQKKGNRFGEKPEDSVPSDDRGAKTPFRLPRDVSLDEDELDIKGTIRPIPPLPEWPQLKICIIGAGISGLYTAMILDSLKIPNLTYEILESSDRIGGQLYTHYFDEEEEHQYYDIGAMRFPRLKIMNRHAPFNFSMIRTDFMMLEHLIYSDGLALKSSL